MVQDFVHQHYDTSAELFLSNFFVEILLCLQPCIQLFELLLDLRTRTLKRMYIRCLAVPYVYIYIYNMIWGFIELQPKLHSCRFFWIFAIWQGNTLENKTMNNDNHEQWTDTELLDSIAISITATERASADFDELVVIFPQRSRRASIVSWSYTSIDMHLISLLNHVPNKLSLLFLFHGKCEICEAYHL